MTITGHGAIFTNPSFCQISGITLLSRHASGSPVQAAGTGLVPHNLYNSRQPNNVPAPCAKRRIKYGVPPLTQYKDENGSTVLYVPSEIVRNERKEHLRVIEDIHKQISLARRVVLNLIILFVLSLSGFLVLLKRKPCSPT